MNTKELFSEKNNKARSTVIGEGKRYQKILLIVFVKVTTFHPF